MKYYLAYGSNLNLDQMRNRCPGAVPVGVSSIPDYQLVFRRGFLTIEPKKGSYVPVGIWKISEANEKALDRYEGFPRFYIKKEFPVSVDGEEAVGMAYIMTDGHPIQRPSGYYLRTVDRGYSDFGFSGDDWLLFVDAFVRSTKEEVG